MGELAEIEKEDQLGGAKQEKEEAHQANMRVNGEPENTDLENLKQLLSIHRQEMNIKDKKIESLEHELGRARLYEFVLSEKDIYLDNLREELRDARDKEQEMTVSLAENKKRIQELETELKIRDKQTELLKNELKLAVEAEEKSTKAMEDLALALKEVATERAELKHARGEAEQLKDMLRTSEEKFEKLLEEAKQEAELHRNTAERLRLEAEETVLAWNGKEMGFVGCIKRAEEERAVVQQEYSKLEESLKETEVMRAADGEEIEKLRDLLKKAVAEADATKTEAGAVRDENSRLKEALSKVEEAWRLLTIENERLRSPEVQSQRLRGEEEEGTIVS